MHEGIDLFVSQCLICQQAKSTTTLPAGLLQSLPIPQQIQEDLAMDSFTGIPASKGYIVILVVVDHLSKHDHFVPLKTDYSSG